MTRRAARTDRNQIEIVESLRRHAITVMVMSHVGNGFPDLVCYDGRPGGDQKIRFVEVKDGDKPPSARKLTPAQERMCAIWPISVVKSVSEALAIFNIEVK